MLCKNVLSTIDLSECPEATYFNGLLHHKEESISAQVLIFTVQKGHTVFTIEFSDKDESSKDVKSIAFSCPFQYFTENYRVKIKLTYHSMS